MTAADLVHRREPDWRRLGELVSGPARRPLTAVEAPETARLYRLALADLARLRTLTASESPHRSEESPAVAWLNDLCVRAYARIHAGGGAPTGRLPWFFTRDLPQRVRAAWRRTALAGAVLLGSAAATFGLAAGDEGLARSLAGPALSNNAEAFRDMARGRAVSDSAVMSAFYVTNNTQVAFISFAAGVTAGVGTLLVLAFNGYAVGITAALAFHLGAAAELGAFLASHAPFELFAIFLAAGAGLGVGHAVVAPGRFSRAVALRRAAADALPLVLGAGCLLALAAPLESFVSPSGLPPAAKVAIGLGNLALLGLYSTRAGRREAATRAP